MDRNTLAGHLGGWHAWVIEDPDGRNAAARAEIRRAASVRDAMMCQAFGDLLTRVRRSGVNRPDAWQVETLARCTLVVAGVSRLTFGKPSFGAAMATERDGRPVVSPIRAKTLLCSRNAGEAADRIRGLTGLMAARLGVGFEICPGDIAAAMSDWDRRKTTWAMDYHSGSCFTHESLAPAGANESFPELRAA